MHENLKWNIFKKTTWKFHNNGEILKRVYVKNSLLTWEKQKKGKKNISRTLKKKHASDTVTKYRTWGLSWKNLTKQQFPNEKEGFKKNCEFSDIAVKNRFLNIRQISLFCEYWIQNCWNVTIFEVKHHGKFVLAVGSMTDLASHQRTGTGLDWTGLDWPGLGLNWIGQFTFQRASGIQRHFT